MVSRDGYVWSHDSQGHLLGTQFQSSQPHHSTINRLSFHDTRGSLRNCIAFKKDVLGVMKSLSLAKYCFLPAVVASSLSLFLCLWGFKLVWSTRTIDDVIHPANEGISASVEARVLWVSTAVAAAHKTHLLISSICGRPYQGSTRVSLKGKESNTCKENITARMGLWYEGAARIVRSRCKARPAAAVLPQHAAS